MRALRGKMNIKRKDIVHKAFAKFDSDGSALKLNGVRVAGLRYTDMTVAT